MKIIADNIKINIIKEYQLGISCRKLMQKYKIDKSTVSKILKQNNIKVKNRGTIYEIDEQLFKEIDCEWKAYFLGLFAADGNIKNNRISINLTEEDGYLLQQLCDIIYKGKKKLYLHKKEGEKIIAGNKCWVKNCYNFYIDNQFITKQIKDLGFTERKSLTLKFPDKGIPKCLMHHFMRGYFDGDGHITKGKKYSISCAFSILSTLDFCKSFQSQLKLFLNIKSKVIPRGKIYYLYVCDAKNVSKLYEFLYKDATIFLKRKYKTFKNHYEQFKIGIIHGRKINDKMGKKLCWSNIDEIKSLRLIKKMRVNDIAKLFNVDRHTISNVLHEKSWVSCI